MLYEIVIGMVAAMIYGLSVYIRKQEPFDVVKLGTTMVIGAVAGAVLVLTGVPVTEAGVLGQMMAMAGLTAIVENLIKKGIKYLQG